MGLDDNKDHCPIILVLVNLFLTKLVRISGFSSLLSAIAVFWYLPTSVLKNTAIADKREENPEILTNLVRKRLTRVCSVQQLHYTETNGFPSMNTWRTADYMKIMQRTIDYFPETFSMYVIFSRGGSQVFPGKPKVDSALVVSWVQSFV